MGAVVGFWGDILYTQLLVMIHIIYTQKWAGGFTEPSRYGCVHMLIQLCKYENAVSQ